MEYISIERNNMYDGTDNLIFNHNPPDMQRYVSIVNNNFHDTQWVGIQLDGAYNSIIDHNQFRNILNNVPITLYGTSYNIAVTYNNFDNTLNPDLGISGLIDVGNTYGSATPVLTSISISPSTASIDIGLTQQFTASPKDQYGNPFNATITWLSGNTTVGTINSTGLFIALTRGTATITASSSGIIGTATATVTAPPVLTTITVTPSTVYVGTGSTQQYSLSQRPVWKSDLSNNHMASSNATVGTINSSGMFTALAQGSITIKASSGNTSGNATVVVTAPPFLTSIIVSPLTATITNGSTQQFTATLKDQFGNPYTATVTWSSGNTTVGTINSAGLFTALNSNCAKWLNSKYISSNCNYTTVGSGSLLEV